MNRNKIGDSDMSEATAEEIIETLEARGVNKPCARCGKNRFSFVSKAMVFIQDDFRNIEIGGKSVPTVTIACDNCGNLSFHAIGALGLLKEAK
jgi:ribosomal protein L37E